MYIDNRCKDCTNVGTSVCDTVCKNGSHFNRNDCITDNCKECNRYPSCSLMVRKQGANEV